MFLHGPKNNGRKKRKEGQEKGREGRREGGRKKGRRREKAEIKQGKKSRAWMWEVMALGIQVEKLIKQNE